MSGLGAATAAEQALGGLHTRPMYSVVTWPDTASSSLSVARQYSRWQEDLGTGT